MAEPKLIKVTEATQEKCKGKMNKEVGQFLKGDEIRTRLAGFGLATSGAGTPESTAAYIVSEQARWRALAQELDIQPQ